MGKWASIGDKLHGGSNIYYYTLYFISLETAKQHKSEVFFLNNFFRKCECIRSYYFPISSNLLKKSFRKISLFMFTVIDVMEKVYFKLLL